MRDDRKQSNSRRALPTSHAGLVLLIALVLLACNDKKAPKHKSSASKPAAAPAHVDPSRPLTVMTFNVRYGTAHDGDNAWKHRREHLFDVIRKYAPDILGTQEVLHFQLEEIEKALPGYDAWGVGRDDGKEAGEYSAIFFDRKRFDRLDGGTFWFSDTPEKICSTSWGNNLCRICTWARFRDKDTGRTFYHFNVHLDHQSANSRLRSAELLLKRIDQRSGADPVILTGDFNAGEDSPPILAIKAGHIALAGAKSPVQLVDTYRIAHPDAKEDGTFNGFEGRRTGPKIDYIFVPIESFKVAKADIVHDSFDGHYPSDHFPVWARLQFLRAPAKTARVHASQ